MYIQQMTIEKSSKLRVGGTVTRESGVTGITGETVTRERGVKGITGGTVTKEKGCHWYHRWDSNIDNEEDFWRTHLPHKAGAQSGLQ